MEKLLSSSINSTMRKGTNIDKKVKNNSLRIDQNNIVINQNTRIINKSSNSKSVDRQKIKISATLKAKPSFNNYQSIKNNNFLSMSKNNQYENSSSDLKHSTSSNKFNKSTSTSKPVQSVPGNIFNNYFNIFNTDVYNQFNLNDLKRVKANTSNYLLESQNAGKIKTINASVNNIRPKSLQKSLETNNNNIEMQLKNYNKDPEFNCDKTSCYKYHKKIINEKDEFIKLLLLERSKLKLQITKLSNDLSQTRGTMVVSPVSTNRENLYHFSPNNKSFSVEEDKFKEDYNKLNMSNSVKNLVNYNKLPSTENNSSSIAVGPTLGAKSFIFKKGKSHASIKGLDIDNYDNEINTYLNQNIDSNRIHSDENEKLKVLSKNSLSNNSSIVITNKILKSNEENFSNKKSTNERYNSEELDLKDLQIEPIIKNEEDKKNDNNYNQSLDQIKRKLHNVLDNYSKLFKKKKP